MPGELAARHTQAGVLCVDTRGSMAYRIGHLPGSVNIRDDSGGDAPVRDAVPAGRTIVLICPSGDHSQRLAALLTRAGHDAASLAGGIVACA
jgi:rhodanese-related sulfurtransferase